MKIKSAVLREPNKPLTIEELELDPPKEKEVLVKYAYTGYCHSDLSVMTGAVHMDLPMAIGHEAAGIVEKVGPGVTTLKKGDHVVTIGGVHGTVVGLKNQGKIVVIKVDKNTNLSVVKSSIAGLAESVSEQDTRIEA